MDSIFACKFKAMQGRRNESPALLPGEGLQLTGCVGIIGLDRYRVGRPHRAGCAQSGPGAFHAPRIDMGGVICWHRDCVRCAR